MANNAYVKEIAEKLKAGVKTVLESGEYADYLRFVKGFYDYSLNNTMLIYMQRPNATYVAGYNTWKNQYNRYVKKGEKAIKIFAPMLRKGKRDKVNDDGKVEQEEYTWYDFRVVNVFDISQTEGDEVPSTLSFCKELTGDISDYENIIRRLESYAGIPVQFTNDLSGANGTYNKAMQVITIKENMSEAQTIKTLIHEIAHSRMHCVNGEAEHADRNTKELQAESVAFIVCNVIGIDTSDYSFGYVATWSKDKDVTEIQSNLEIIMKTAKEIIKGAIE